MVKIIILHLHGDNIAFHFALLTFRSHSQGQAFLEAAVLTSVSVMLCNWTVSVSSASIAKLFPDAPLEEAFTTLTANDSIMAPCKLINYNGKNMVTLIVLITIFS